MILRLLTVASALAVALALAVTDARAQRRDLSDVEVKDVGNGPITSDDDVIGYYFLYRIGKAKKGEFLLVLTDGDLEPIQRIELEMDATSKAVRGYFNGTAVCLLTYTGQDLELHTFSAAGEPLGHRTLASRPEYLLRHFWLEQTIGEGATALVTPVPGKGFVLYRPWLKSGQGEYTILFLPDDLDEAEGWTYESDKGRGLLTRRSVTLLATPDYVVTRLINRHRTDGHANDVEVRRVSDGSLAFAYDPDDGETSMRIQGAYFDADAEALVFAGTRFASGADQYEGDGDGIAIARVNMSGEEVARASYTWAQVAGELGAAAASHFDRGGRMHVHRVVRQPSGGYVFVGEAYVTDAGRTKTDDREDLKRRRKGLPPAWEQYQDFAAVSLTEDFALAGGQTFGGQRTKPEWFSINFAPGSTDPTYLEFDDVYHYGQSLPGGRGYVFAYYRYPDKLEASKELVVVTDYGDGEGAFEKVFRPSDGATESRYIMAKPGFVLVNENFADKAPTLRLEPVD